MKNHVHKCGPHCLRQGECRARFPREARLESTFDELGALQLKHKEPVINSFTSLVDYLIRCNTDTTCLLSGTQVKAVIAYIPDYITKYQLKKYTLFEVICTVPDKHADIVHDSGDRGEAARRLMTKIVNALNAKLETGAPCYEPHCLGILTITQATLLNLVTGILIFGLWLKFAAWI
ncbi:hypothetical protein QCA50_007963 [Cerrena zonata]|uniref:Uncharacterized protein n=1 Tax=Cerrena zonata TaxID=2478898 RepID=A0AAW0FAG6_9APHY